jgi:hypothetical protein
MQAVLGGGKDWACLDFEIRALQAQGEGEVMPKDQEE